MLSSPWLYVVLVVIACILILNSGPDNIDSPDSAVRLKAVKECTDQAALFSVVINEIRPEIRSVALGSLTNQMLIKRLADESALPDVQKWAVARIDDETALAELAINAKDSGIRAMAIMRVTFDPLLMRVVRESKDCDVRCQALKKTANQAFLEELCLHSDEPRLRSQALKGLTNQVALLRVAEKTSADLGVRYGAVERLFAEEALAIGRVTIDSLLMRVVRESKDLDVRCRALKRTANQAFLEELCLHSYEPRLRSQALEGITNQVALLRIAEKTSDPDVRYGAVKRLFAEEALTKFAIQSADSRVRQEATERLKEQTSLEKVALCSTDRTTVIQASKRLTNQKILIQLFQGSSDKQVQEEIFDLITDQEFLAQRIQEERDDWARGHILRRLTNETMIARIALVDSDWSVRREAVRKLNDQALLYKLAKESRERDIRRAAVEKISDQALLYKLAKEARLHETRRAAVLKMADLPLLVDLARNSFVTISAVGRVREVYGAKLQEDVALSDLAAQARLFQDSASPEKDSTPFHRVKLAILSPVIQRQFPGLKAVATFGVKPKKVYSGLGEIEAKDAPLEIELKYRGRVLAQQRWEPHFPPFIQYSKEYAHLVGPVGTLPPINIGELLEKLLITLCLSQADFYELAHSEIYSLSEAAKKLLSNEKYLNALEEERAEEREQKSRKRNPYGSASDKKDAKSPDYTLKGVLFCDKVPLALIDGQVLHLGEKIHDFSIEKITADLVVLTNAQGVVKELRVK